MLLGGAAVNALAFSGSNYLFSMLRSSGLDEERKRHDKAVEPLQAAQAEWSKQRTERLDWINEELRRQGHAVQTFHDVDMAIREYARVTGQNSDEVANTFGVMGLRPRLLHAERWPERPRTRLCCCRDGCYRPSGVQTRQVIVMPQA